MIITLNYARYSCQENIIKKKFFNLKYITLLKRPLSFFFGKRILIFFLYDRMTRIKRKKLLDFLSIELNIQMSHSDANLTVKVR
jgi:hypothetical protein